jgi:uncharacterized membrane protein
MKKDTKQFKLKKFIKEFNFPDPNWSSLPEGFPYLNKKGLTTEEGHLLDAVELAWLTTGTGRSILYKKIARVSLATIAVIIIGIFAKTVLKNPESKYLKSAKAATISATLKHNGVNIIEDVVESTMSAIHKKN